MVDFVSKVFWDVLFSREWVEQTIVLLLLYQGQKIFLGCPRNPLSSYHVFLIFLRVLTCTILFKTIFMLSSMEWRQKAHWGLLATCLRISEKCYGKEKSNRAGHLTSSSSLHSCTHIHTCTWVHTQQYCPPHSIYAETLVKSLHRMHGCVFPHII